MSLPRRGRGRLSSFDTLPPEAEGIVAWAAQELSARKMTQVEIYREFVARCEALMAERRGELEFQIPAFASFHRLSVRLALLTRRLAETRQIVAAIADKFDAKESDELTIMTAETIKSLVLHLLAEADERIEPKDAMHLAAAFKSALQAQSISSDRRRKAQAEFETQVSDAVDRVARRQGMSAETAEAIKAQILGVAA